MTSNCLCKRTARLPEWTEPLSPESESLCLNLSWESSNVGYDASVAKTRLSETLGMISNKSMTQNYTAATYR